MFGSTGTSAPNGGGEGSDEEDAPKNVDIHFEPIVSLPEVRQFVLHMEMWDFCTVCLILIVAMAICYLLLTKMASLPPGHGGQKCYCMCFPSRQ